MVGLASHGPVEVPLTVNMPRPMELQMRWSRVSGPPHAVELGRRLHRGSLAAALGSPDRWKESVMEMDDGACGRAGRVRASAKKRGAGREKKNR